MSDLVATSSVTVKASPSAVWHAITDPATIAKYYFGTKVETDWRVGSPIAWSGEYEGKAYRDHGTILDLSPEHLLRHTHFSPLSGREDIPENYHTLDWRLEPEGDETRVTLSQDNNDDYDSVKHSEQNWTMVLDGLKKVVESSQRS